MKKANNKQTARHGSIRSSILLCPVILATIGGTFYGEAVAVTAQIQIGGVLKIQQEGRIYIGKNGKIETTGKIINESKDSELKGTLTFSGTNDTFPQEADKMPSAIHNHGDMFYYKTGTDDPNLVKDTSTENTGAHAYHIDYSGFVNDLDNTEKVDKDFITGPATVDAYKYTGNDYSSTKLLDSDETRAKAAYFDLVNDKADGTATDRFNIYQNARTYTQISKGHLTVDIPFSDSAGFSADLENNSLDILPTGEYNFTKISDDEYEGSSGDHKEVIRSYDSFYKGPNIREVPSWKFVDPDDGTKTIGTVYRVGNIYKFAVGDKCYDEAEPLTYDEIDKKYKNSDGTKSFKYSSTEITYTDADGDKTFAITKTTNPSGTVIVITGLASIDKNYEYEYGEGNEVKTKLFEKTTTLDTYEYNDGAGNIDTLKLGENGAGKVTITIQGTEYTETENTGTYTATINGETKTIRLRNNTIFLEHVAGKASHYEGYVSPSKNTAEAAEAAIQSRLQTAKVIGDSDSGNVTFKHEYNDLVQNKTLSDNAYDIDSATRTLRGYTNTLEYDADNSTISKEAKGSFYSIYGYEKGYAKADDYLNGATNFLYGRNKQYDSDGNLTGDDGTPVNIPPVDKNSVLAVKAKDGTNLTQYNADVCDELCDSGFKFSAWSDDDPVITYSGDNSYYNGTFKQGNGGVIVPNTGSIVGGRYEMGSIANVNAVANTQYNSLGEFHDALTGPRRYEEAQELLEKLQEKNNNGTLTQDDAIDFFYLAGTKFKDILEDYDTNSDNLGDVKLALGTSDKVLSEILSTDNDGKYKTDSDDNYLVDARKLLYNIGKSLQKNGSASGNNIAGLNNIDGFEADGISNAFMSLAVKGKAYKDDLEANETAAKACQTKIGKQIIMGNWDPTELEWQGGPKDEYNRPSIEMAGGSTIYFNLLNETTFDPNSNDTYYVKRNDGTIEKYDDSKDYFRYAVEMEKPTKLKYYRAQEDDNGAWVLDDSGNYRKLNTTDDPGTVIRYSMIETDSTDQDGNPKTDIFVKNTKQKQYEAYSDSEEPYNSADYEYQESESPKKDGDNISYKDDAGNPKSESYNENIKYCSSGYQCSNSNSDSVQLYKSDIFSFYGSLHGTENDRVIFEHGHVKIKGDCSGFLGSVGVVQGAEFTVEQSDSTSSSVYKGSFPQANVYQVKNDGSLVTPENMTLDEDSFTTINSQNMKDVEFNNGIYKLNGQDGQTQLDEVSVGAGAIVQTTADNTELNGCNIEGVLETTGDINSVNTTINGGVLVARSVTTQNSSVGSTFVSWGNDNYHDVFTINRVGGTQGTFRIQDDHSLKFFADFNVEDKDSTYDDIYQSDRINAEEAGVVTSGKGIMVAGMNIKGTPTEDVYKFMVYTGPTAANTQAMPINLGADYGDEKYDTLQVYSNANTGTSANFQTNTKGLQWYSGTAGAPDVPYTYTQTGADALTVTKDETQTHTDNENDITSTYAIDIDGLGNIYYVGALGTTDGTNDKGYLYLFRAAGSSAANADQISNILSHYVTADTGYEVLGTLDLFDFVNSGTSSRNMAHPGRIVTPAKYRLWNKTFGEHSTIEMNTDFDSKLSAIGTMFGFDMEAKALNSKNLYLMPTVFAGVDHNMIKYASTKYRTDSYFGGIKGALFNSKHAVEAYGLYEFYRTKASSTRVKTHALSLGTKYEYNLPMKCNWSFRPGVFASYVYLHSPSFETGANSSTHKIKNRHKFEVAPVVSLNRQCGLWNSRAFVSYHQKFGTKGKSTINTTTYSIDKAKKYFMEYGLEVSRINAKDTAKFGLKLSRKTLGVKGFKGALTVGVKL